MNNLINESSMKQKPIHKNQRSRWHEYFASSRGHFSLYSEATISFIIITIIRISIIIVVVIRISIKISIIISSIRINSSSIISIRINSISIRICIRIVIINY